MTTATLTPSGDLPGMILEHLQGLERSSREAVRWVSDSLVAPTGGSFQRVAARIKITLALNDMVGKYERLIRDTEDQIIWFRGLKATIEDGSQELGDDAWKLTDAMEGAQRSMKDLRIILLGAKPTFAKATKSPSLRARRLNVLQRLISVEAEAYAALESARWAVLEREADDDIAAGRRGPTFTNADDLIAHLNSGS